MILIHGAGGDHTVWAEVHGRLRKLGVPVLALDLPGHGRNAAPAPSTVSERADAVLEITQGAGVQKYVAVGHSLGGAVALSLALRRPQGLRGIGIVSSGARLPVDPRVLQSSFTTFASTVEYLSRFLFAKGAAPRQIAEAAAMLAEAGPETFHADFSACASFGVDVDALRVLDLPAEVVCGDADVLTPMPLSEALACALPRAHLTKLAGVGHLPLLEDPAGLTAALGQLWRWSFCEDEER